MQFTSNNKVKNVKFIIPIYKLDKQELKDKQMNNGSKVEQNGLLAELAYLKLEKYTGSYTDLTALKNFMHQKDPKTGKLIGGIDDGRQSKMLDLLNKYEIVGFKSDPITGFQGMILKEKDTNEYTIAFRGTAGTQDALVDGGIAQITINKNFQYSAAKSFTENFIKDKGGDIKKHLTLTGHSLGGILVQQVAAAERIKGYSYNALGADALIKYFYPASSPLGGGERMLDFFGLNLHNKDIDFIKNNVINVSYQDNGKLNGDPLSNIGTHANLSNFPSGILPIFGENKGLGAHSIVGLNETIAKYNEIIKHFKDLDLKTLSNFYALAGYEKMNKTFEDLNIASSAPNSLQLKTSASFAKYDPKFDLGMNYALNHNNKFVVVGELSAYAPKAPQYRLPKQEVTIKGTKEGYGKNTQIHYKASNANVIELTDKPSLISFIVGEKEIDLVGIVHSVAKNVYESETLRFSRVGDTLIVEEKNFPNDYIIIKNWNSKSTKLILSNDKAGTYTSSLLPPDAKYDNTQIAEFSTNENKDDLVNTEALAYVPGTMIFPTTIDAKDVVLASDTSNKNDDDNGMVM